VLARHWSASAVPALTAQYWADFHSAAGADTGCQQEASTGTQYCTSAAPVQLAIYDYLCNVCHKIIS